MKSAMNYLECQYRRLEFSILGTRFRTLYGTGDGTLLDSSQKEPMKRKPCYAIFKHAHRKERVRFRVFPVSGLVECYQVGPFIEYEQKNYFYAILSSPERIKLGRSGVGTNQISGSSALSRRDMPIIRFRSISTSGTKGALHTHRINGARQGE